jgi:hypothetical protein
VIIRFQKEVTLNLIVLSCVGVQFVSLTGTIYILPCHTTRYK